MMPIIGAAIPFYGAFNKLLHGDFGTLNPLTLAKRALVGGGGGGFTGELAEGLAQLNPVTGFTQCVSELAQGNLTEGFMGLIGLNRVSKVASSSLKVLFSDNGGIEAAKATLGEGIGTVLADAVKPGTVLQTAYSKCRELVKHS